MKDTPNGKTFYHPDGSGTFGTTLAHWAAMKASPLLLILSVLFSSAACAPVEERATLFVSDADEIAEAERSTAPLPTDEDQGCTDGEIRACSETVHQASGVTSCWGGSQTCAAGAWETCVPFRSLDKIADQTSEAGDDHEEKEQVIIVRSPEGILGEICSRDAPCGEPSEDITSFTEILEAHCPEQQSPHWTRFDHDAATPGESGIQFQLHSAHRLSELPRSTPLLSMIADANSDVETCENGVSCHALAARDPAPLMKVSVTLIPANDGTERPAVRSWRLHYVCLD